MADEGNPYHDRVGKFSTEGAAVTVTYTPDSKSSAGSITKHADAAGKGPKLAAADAEDDDDEEDDAPEAVPANDMAKTQPKVMQTGETGPQGPVNVVRPESLDGYVPQSMQGTTAAKHAATAHKNRASHADGVPHLNRKRGR